MSAFEQKKDQLFGKYDDANVAGFSLPAMTPFSLWNLPPHPSPAPTPMFGIAPCVVTPGVMVA